MKFFFHNTLDLVKLNILQKKNFLFLRSFKVKKVTQFTIDGVTV
jgi:hypothetical protein